MVATLRVISSSPELADQVRRLEPVVVHVYYAVCPACGERHALAAQLVAGDGSLRVRSPGRLEVWRDVCLAVLTAGEVLAVLRPGDLAVWTVDETGQRLEVVVGGAP